MPWCRINELRRIKHGVWFVIVISSVLTTVACVPPKVTVTSSPGFQPSTIHTLAVLPFQTLSTPQRYSPNPSPSMVAPPEIRSQFSLPVPQSERGGLANTHPVKVSTLASERITRMVYESLENRAGLRVVTPIDVSTVLSTYGSQESNVNWKEKVKQVGTRLGVNGVLIGLVRTYRERVGTKIGATPAAVGFEVHLVDPLSGRIHWTGEYYEEQKPMNEDLMGFVERGGAFVTAKELAEYGVQKIMQQFPVGDAGPASPQTTGNPS